MKSSYFEFDGDLGRFLGPDDLFPSAAFIDFVLQYGQDGLDALRDADEQVQQIINEMIAAGLLDKDEQGNLHLTERMHRGMQHHALLEIFRRLKGGVRDGHPSADPGRHGERADGTHPYQFGDPLSELALGESMRNAIRRLAASPAQPDAPAAILPIRFQEADFELHQVESSTTSALCVLIDLSGSMMRYGRHIAAKRVAMGLRSLVREKFPLDRIEFIGFATTAEPLADKDLPMVMPKPVTTREWEVRVRIPLDQADQTHPHFTNLHHALRLARTRLARQNADNRQIFIITDGQPTAHLSGDNADILNLIYPPSETSAEVTLREALTCAQQGIRISSFALIEEYYGMEWVGFIDQLTRLVRGVAFYCTAGDLDATILESYLTGRREKKPLW